MANLLSDEQIFAQQGKTNSLLENILGAATEVGNIMNKRVIQERQAENYNIGVLKEVVSDAKINKNAYDVNALEDMKKNLKNVSSGILNPSKTMVELTKAKIENLDDAITDTENWETLTGELEGMLLENGVFNRKHLGGKSDGRKLVLDGLDRVAKIETELLQSGRLDSVTSKNITAMQIMAEDILDDFGNDNSITADEAKAYNKKHGLKENVSAAEKDYNMNLASYKLMDARYKKLLDKDRLWAANRNPNDLTEEVLYPALSPDERADFINLPIQINKFAQGDLKTSRDRYNTLKKEYFPRLTDPEDDEENQMGFLRDLSTNEAFPEDVVSIDSIRKALEEAETGSVSDDSTTVIGAQNSDGTYDLGSYQVNERWLFSGDKSYEKNAQGDKDVVYAQIQDKLKEFVPGWENLSNEERQKAYLGLTKDQQWDVSNQIYANRGLDQWATKNKVLDILEKENPDLKKVDFTSHPALKQTNQNPAVKTTTTPTTTSTATPTTTTTTTTTQSGTVPLPITTTPPAKGEQPKVTWDAKTETYIADAKSPEAIAKEIEDLGQTEAAFNKSLKSNWKQLDHANLLKAVQKKEWKDDPDYSKEQPYEGFGTYGEEEDYMPSSARYKGAKVNKLINNHKQQSKKLNTKMDNYSKQIFKDVSQTGDDVGAVLWGVQKNFTKMQDDFASINNKTVENLKFVLEKIEDKTFLDVYNNADATQKAEMERMYKKHLNMYREIAVRTSQMNGDVELITKLLKRR